MKKAIKDHALYAIIALTLLIGLFYIAFKSFAFAFTLSLIIWFPASLFYVFIAESFGLSKTWKRIGVYIACIIIAIAFLLWLVMGGDSFLNWS